MLLICSIYILFLLILLSGFFQYLGSTAYAEDLKISIVAAAKNEASGIRNFINSVKKIDYPAENYELIIVDDNSTDDTYKVTSDLIKGHNNIKILPIFEKSLPGKRSALLKAIEQSAFPYIVITDADCVVSPGWLKCFCGAFKDKYEFVFGPSAYFQKKNLINHISCMENLKNQFLSFSLAELALPYTAAARSMGFSKELFFRIGGYSKTGETPGGDDDLLLREALKYKPKVKTFYDKNALVYSETKTGLQDYLSQKARHTQSSFHYNLKNKIILGIWHLLNLFLLLSPVLVFINTHFLWLFAIKMITDTMVLSVIQRKFGYDFNPLQILYLNILYELFIIINFFNALFKKIEWK